MDDCLKGITNISISYVFSDAIKQTILEDQAKAKFELSLQKNGIPIDPNSPNELLVEINGFYSHDGNILCDAMQLSLCQNQLIIINGHWRQKVMAKHVIFLGAGASYTSGYPLAAELRQILSSSDAFRNYIGTKFNNSTLTELILTKFNEYEKLIHLFRKGGFGTIDEFSFLSRGRHKDGVQTLKLFLSLIFASHCPELPYQKAGGRSGGWRQLKFSSDDYQFGGGLG
jgi:hypothetical protein